MLADTKKLNGVNSGEMRVQGKKMEMWHPIPGTIVLPPEPQGFALNGSFLHEKFAPVHELILWQQLNQIYAASWNIQYPSYKFLPLLLQQ